MGGEKPNNGLIHLAFPGDQYQPGQTYNLTLESTENDIAGFLLYAEDSQQFRHGQWKIVSGTQYKQGCNGVDGSSLTHTTSSNWGRTAVFTWTAPEDPIELTFKGVGVRKSFMWHFLPSARVMPMMEEKVNIKFVEPEPYVVGEKNKIKVKVQNKGAPLQNSVVIIEGVDSIVLKNVKDESCVMKKEGKYECSLMNLPSGEKMKYTAVAKVKKGDGKLKVTVKNQDGDKIKSKTLKVSN